MTATIVRPLHGRIQVRGLRGPRGDEPSNRQMFKTATGTAIRPTWVPAPKDSPPWQGYWEIARPHLTDVAEAIAIRDGQVEIEMHYSTAEQCDQRCQSAEGDECTCSCEGKYHGNNHHASWIEVGDTTLVRNSGSKVVTRTLTRKQAKKDRDARLDELVRQVTRRQ
ncbi:hypothetical protein ABC195_16480 [Microbacterium sp. 2P01SA-2]|uniref:hypothetical protein n=1 Tax=Microbacterium TaxID=33882 RepID=UPI001AE17969|nr:hypothetical protein [Microbacterium imperiale]MBP2422196.1 hypothetical protein [Microbacterium imperiale]MDS0200706.1 hypothetical protein [Microbacterium imperiale]